MSPRCDRCLYQSFSILGCGLMGVAIYLYFSSPDPSSETAPNFLLEVAETELEFTDCIPGEKRDVVFRLDNRSGKPMRVLGLPGC